MIELRRVQSDDDIDAFLAVRGAIDQEHLLVRAAYVEHVKAPGRFDVLALAEGEPVAAAFVEPHHGNLTGDTGYVSVRVLRERRRQGIGTELFRAMSERARASGWGALYSVARHDDEDTLAYLPKRGFAEVLRMQELSLDLSSADGDGGAADVEVVPLTPELEPSAFDATREIYPDLPGEAVELTGGIDEWRRNELPGHTIRSCTLAALAEGQVVGYATLHEAGDGVGIHGITGVRRAWRGRGVALALKRAQIAAAQTAGLRELRTTTAFQNAPMLRVNERLGYRRGVAWIHLRGPLLDGETP